VNGEWEETFSGIILPIYSLFTMHHPHLIQNKVPVVTAGSQMPDIFVVNSE
jgi:hypothetical protein